MKTNKIIDKNSTNLNIDNVESFFISKKIFSIDEIQKMINIIYRHYMCPGNEINENHILIINSLLDDLDENVDTIYKVGHKIVRFVKEMMFTKFTLEVSKIFIDYFNKKSHPKIDSEIEFLKLMIEYENNSIEELNDKLEIYSDLEDKVYSVVECIKK